MSTDLPLGLSKVLLDLNADGIVDVLASGRLSDYPGKQDTKAYLYFREQVNLGATHAVQQRGDACTKVLTQHVGGDV